jgi:flagellin
VHSDQASFSFQVGTGTTANDLITANIGAVSATALGVDGTEAATGNYVITTGITNADGATPGTDDSAFSAAFTAGSSSAALRLTVTQTANDDTDATNASYSSGSFSFVLEGKEISVTIGANGTDFDTDGVANATATAINNAGLNGITATAGASGVVTIAKVSALSVSSTENATAAVDAIDTAINTVNTQRANLGAISNRLDSTISNLTNISTNLEAGRASIQDADFAAESTSLAKSQILQQASTAMLAQANASKQGVLQLLQG